MAFGEIQRCGGLSPWNYEMNPKRGTIVAIAVALAAIAALGGVLAVISSMGINVAPFNSLNALTTAGGSILAGGSGVIFILGLSWIITKSIQSCYNGIRPHRRQPEANSLASKPSTKSIQSRYNGIRPHRRQPEATNPKITKARVFFDKFLLQTKSTKDLKTQANIHAIWKQTDPLDERCYGTHRKKTHPLLTETRAEAYEEIYKELSIEKKHSILEIGCGPPLNDKSWYSLGMERDDFYYSDCKSFVEDPRRFFVVDLDDTDSVKLPTKMKALVAINVFTCQLSSILVNWFENAKSLLDKDGLVFVFTDTVPFFPSSVVLLLKKEPDSLVFPCINSRTDFQTGDHLLHISKSQLVKALDKFQIDSQEYKFLDYLRIQSEELSLQEKRHLAHLMYEGLAENIRIMQEVLQALMPNEQLKVNVNDRHQHEINEAFQKANYKVEINKEYKFQKEYSRSKESSTNRDKQINSINSFLGFSRDETGPIDPDKTIQVTYKFRVIVAKVNSD